MTQEELDFWEADRARFRTNISRGILVEALQPACVHGIQPTDGGCGICGTWGN